MNSPEIHDHPVYAKLFSATVPDSVPGFCLSKEESQKMDEVWPAGTAHARKILHRFLYTRTRRAQLGVVDPLSAGEEVDVKLSRASLYKDQRDKGDRDSTSRLRYACCSSVSSARLRYSSASQSLLSHRRDLRSRVYQRNDEVARDKEGRGQP